MKQVKCIWVKFLCFPACLLGFGASNAQDSSNTQYIIDSVFEQVALMDSVVEQIENLESQANYYHDFAPWTRVFLDSALAMAKRENLDKEVALAIFNHMQFYVFNTKFDSALYMFDQGMALEIVHKEPGIKADYYAQLATVYKKQGNAKAAIKNFVVAMSLMEKSGYLESLELEENKIDAQRSLVIINNNLANLYQDLRDFSAAHKAYQKAYDLLLTMDEKAIAGTVWMNKGSTYLNEGKLDSAYIVQLEAQQLKQEGEASVRSLAMSNLNVGNALMALGRLSEAEVQFDKALAAFEEIGNMAGLANTLVDRGELWLAEGDFIRARNDCSRGKGISREVDQLDFQANACDCLFKAYKALGNFARALENHEELKQLHDSLRNDENTRYITQLEMQYDFDREEEARLVKEHEQALLQQDRDQRTRRALVLLSILLGSAILLAYQWYRNFRIKKRSEAVLEEKNSIITKALDEKKLLLKEIHHRVKNNLQVISSLLRLQSRYIEDDTALDAITAGRSRVQAMALLHENLYREDNLKGVDMQSYFDKLVDGIFRALNTDDDRIKLKKEIAPISLDIDSVVPIGLITNELITNALKHAFTEQEEGEVIIRLFESGERLYLEVEDNGKGMPPDFFGGKVTSFGHKLIKAFVINLGAKIEVSVDGGAKIRLIIRKYQKAG